MLRIALTTRVVVQPSTGEVRDALARDWVARLDGWNMLALPVPNGLAEPAAYLDAVAPDLLVLTGGDDWGATPDRDASELALLTAALARDLPVLGVCRGLQVLNLHFGGTLERVQGHVARDHTVAVDGAWRTLYGDSVAVNSFHNVTIAANGLAAPLVAAARDAAGHVEAAHHESAAVAGVMWHPERPAAPAADRRLFECMAAGDMFWR